MSAITTVFNALHTRVAAVLPFHVRLSNPYVLEQNSVDFLRKGYGIAFGGATDNKRNIKIAGCKRHTIRDFNVTLTQQYYARELDGAAKDITALALMEDLNSLVDDFVLDTSLNNTDDIKITDYSSDDGINTILAESDYIYSVTATFSVEYADTL